MCKECVTKLSRAFSFRKQCREADEYLRTEVIKHEIDTIEPADNDVYDSKIDVDNGDFKVEILEEYYIDESSKYEEVEDIKSEIIDADFIYETEYLDSTLNEIISPVVNCENADEDRVIIEMTDDELLKNAIVVDAEGNILDDIVGEIIDNDNSNEIANDESLQPPKKKKAKKDPKAEPSEWLCDDCGKVCKTKDAYTYHLAKVHNPELYKKRKEKYMGDFECEHCGRKFTNLIMYKRHLNLHDPNNPNVCDVCGKLYADKNTLASHMISHQEKTLKCEVCGKLIDTVKNLENHMRFHTGERPYICSYCNEGFITSSNLRAHERMHSNITYTCNECNKVYKSERTFKKHVRTHNPDKYYDCQYCDRKFISSRDRNKHLYTHPEFKPFICTYCGKTFISENALDVHVRMSHIDNTKLQKQEDNIDLQLIIE